MSRPDAIPEPLFPEPLFSEPWQAEAFALLTVLRDQGRVSAADWAKRLGTALRDEGAAEEPEAFHRAWLTALEGLTLDSGLSTRDELDARRRTWAEAYAHTPHGQPVRLHQG